MGKSLDKFFKAVVNELKKNCLICENLRSWNRSSHRWTWKVAEFAMLGNTYISKMASNTLSWTSLLSLIVCKRGNSPLQNQSIIWENQVRGWLPICISLPKGQTRNKRKDFPLLTLLIRTSGSCSRILRIHLI